jgi:hypothetical protein
MKGDFSRVSFRPKQHYHGVLKQQGRVDLDSDWNEQGAITSHRIEGEAVDVIGASGAPQDHAGFLMLPANNGASLSISAGRAYVDGILCENEAPNLLITAQPDLPAFTLPTTPGDYVAYLRVWERHVTFLDDSEILEVALGGPDTCTRAKTVWQVELVQAGAVGANITCATDVPAYDALIAPSTGKLQAQAQPTTTTDPCMVPATAGYRSLENQLYRVEIHKSGTGDATAGATTATFKWSRDNGSVVAAWIAPPSGQNPGPNTIFVSSTGKDSVLGFAAGQWVELCDDAHELNFQPGTLVQVVNVQGQVLTVDPTTVIPAGASLNRSDYTLNPKVRRWDSIGAAPATTGTFLNLENGIQVQFSSGSYTTGDYWLIPARTLTANIDWPVDASNQPLAEPPRGIRRHYCQLAIVQFDGKVWTVVATCLPVFPPLTDLAQKGIHITDVRLLSPDQELANDSDVALTFAEEEFGIRVLLDGAVDPVSAQPTTCFVTVDVPYPLKDAVASIITANLNNALRAGANLAAAGIDRVSTAGLIDLPILGYQPLILPGKVGAATSTNANGVTVNQITWTPANPRSAVSIIRLLEGLLEVMPALQPTSRLLTHLTLKGDFIWSLADPTVYLDGESFGVARTDSNGTHIGLRLPKSGNGIHGGDFEMWFWLVLPVTIVSLNFSPNSVTVGSTPSSTGTLQLLGTQLNAGNTVTLTATANDAGGKPITTPVATIPATVPLGTTPAPTFQLTNFSLPPGIPSATLQVTAKYGNTQAVGSLTILAPVSLARLAFTQQEVFTQGGASTATLVVTLRSVNGDTVCNLERARSDGRFGRNPDQQRGNRDLGGRYGPEFCNRAGRANQRQCHRHRGVQDRQLQLAGYRNAGRYVFSEPAHPGSNNIGDNKSSPSDHFLFEAKSAGESREPLERVITSADARR